MYFSRKNILTKGKRPLNAVSRVINASCGSASSTFARCWVHSTNKTSALFRTVKNQGFRRAYSTKNGADGQGTGAGGLQAGLGLPFYRTTIIRSPLVRATDVGLRQNH
jgi:phosphatidylserine decarboxylase